MTVVVGLTRVRHKAKTCYMADVAYVCGRTQLGMSSTYNSEVPTLGECKILASSNCEGVYIPIEWIFHWLAFGIQHFLCLNATLPYCINSHFPYMTLCQGCFCSPQ